MIKISMTYSKFDSDSAECGETCDHGFIDQQGNEYSMLNKAVLDDIVENGYLYRVPHSPGDLAMALRWALSMGICNRSSSEVHQGMWWSSEPKMDMHTGEYEEVSLHVDGATISTLKRIDKILDGR